MPMRIVRYGVEQTGDRTCVLVKESSNNCPDIQSLDGPGRIAEMLNYLYRANRKAEEYVWMIGLDANSNPVGIFEISHGTVNMSYASPREVFVRLCLCGAAGFVLAHNHPGGSVTPSLADMELTQRMYDAGTLMNIPLLDHVIICGDTYYSFRAEKNIIKC